MPPPTGPIMSDGEEEDAEREEDVLREEGHGELSTGSTSVE